MSIMSQVEGDEYTKYDMWSTYVYYMLEKTGNQLEDMDTLEGLMTYFGWLDHFGLT